MFRRCLFIAFAVYVSAGFAAVSERDSLLRELDRTVSEATYYRSLQEIKIANAQKEFLRAAGNEERVRTAHTLSILFFFYKNDSALIYNEEALQIAENMHDNTLYVNLVCERALLFGHAGLSTFAFQILDSLVVSPKAASPELKRFIYESYFDINDFVYHLNLPGTLLTQNAKFLAELRDSFYHYCPDNIEQALHSGAAITNNKEVIDKLKMKLLRSENDQERALLSMVISNRYRNEAMPEQREIYLIKAAIYNIRAARMDNEALIVLAKQLLNDGDWNRAETYLRLAHEQALFYGSRSREVQLSPLLQQVYQHLSQRFAFWHTVGVVSIVLVLLLLVGAAFLWRNVRRRQHLMRRQMNLLSTSSANAAAREANSLAQVEAQSDALKHFMGIATDATFEYVHLRHQVVRKLKNNDAAGLLNQLTSEANSEKTQRELLRRFDIAFMRLYPNFIANVNALMLPEAQISKPENELMSTELRLLAFWRLGITDAGRVATILNLSVNTVYFYRNKLRNGAKDREHFNDGIMDIQGV